MSKQPMDLFPLIPGREGGQNAARPLREAFQDILAGEIYHNNIAEYIVNCYVDADLKIKENAEQVLQIYDGLNDDLETIENAGGEIMEQKGIYLIKKNRLENFEELKERARLKHCDLFKNLNLYYVDYFSLLQKCDLLPNTLKQYIDYRLTEDIHLCENCLNVLHKVEKGRVTTNKSKWTNKCEEIKVPLVENEVRISSRGRTTERSEDLIFEHKQHSSSKPTTQKEKKRTESPFLIMPRMVEFYNCELGKAYKKTVKLLNSSSLTQSLVTKDFPKSRTLSVNLDINSKLAPGMSCLATITYKPKLYRNFQDSVSFRNHKGFVKHLPIKVGRASPRLITCVFKSNSYHLNRPRPGSARFLETRREALNSSIDCGSCLVGEYVYLSLFLQNNGTNGKFFIITEDEWYFENIESISTSMEYSSDYLWIYPTFFELNNEETTEINILFYPYKCEMYLEKFYLMCDNNSFQKFEVLGDGLMFNKSVIKIDVAPMDLEINKKEDYCIVLGNFQPNSCTSLILTVHNTGSVLLKCYWKFLNKPIAGYNQIEPTWIETESCPAFLAPYSTTDFKIKIHFRTVVEGYHNIFFSFYISEVPIACLEKGMTFSVAEKKTLDNVLAKSVDVFIMEMNVACYIEHPIEEKFSSSTSESGTISYEDKPVPREPKLAFSSPFLEFGILPNGLSVQKEFYVKNLSVEPIKWKIVEVKYNVDTSPFMEVIKSDNITCDAGEFFCICEKQKIFYNVTKRGPLSWVSMLLLISLVTDTVFEIESICIVTYDIINYDITINGSSESPVLCPMKILYTGISHTIPISVENHSLIAGLFYFLKPYGDGAQYVDIEINPQQAILKPLESATVDIKILSREVGIFENIYIPCFINKGQNCIIVRILLAVDCVHLAMYLPEKNNYYQKILWPPKILFEYDDNWMICPCTLEYSPEMEVSELKSQTHSKTGMKDDSNALPVSSKSSNLKPSDNTSVASTEEGVVDKSLTSSNTSSEESSSFTSKSNESIPECLEDMLQEKFGDELFLQDHVIEVRPIHLKTPTKVTFYLENITPVKSNYTVEATNFYTTRSFDHLAYNLQFKKAEDIWNDMIMNDYGILVLPDVKEGALQEFGLIEFNLTIFANTWGIYQEEIAVDVPDIPCFTFSLLIEVIGCPVIFPLAISKITEYPTIRFGSVAYDSEEIHRKIKISNTSCVPLKILWHNFTKTSPYGHSTTTFNVDLDVTSKICRLEEAKLEFVNKEFGRKIHNLFKITPKDMPLDKNSSDIINVIMKPENCFSQTEDTYIRCSLVGHIFLEEHYRKKLNYFFRPTDLENSNHVRMEILGILELPILRFDFVSGETNIRFYANDVFFNRNFEVRTRLVFLNNHSCVAELEMNIDEPLEILGQRKGKNTYVVQPLSCLEVVVNCNVDYERILHLSEVVYPHKHVDAEELQNKMNVQDVDTSLKILHLQRKLKMMHKGALEKVIPLNVYIHYPYISAKPSNIKLDQVFLGKTHKTVVTVFNHTGCLINFEIFKSLASEVLYVKPHFGKIEKSTGVNKSFCNIFIYFTPREARQYQESIRIVTNIPNYFIEVPIKATGSINEKFYIDYKI